MRRLTIFLLSFIFGVAGVNAQQNAIRISLKDGSENVIFLSNDPVMKIDGTVLQIYSGTSKISYPLSDLKGYSFITDESGITANTVKETADYKRAGDIIIFGVNGSEVDYSVVSTSGMTMANGRGMQCSIDISGYLTGVYILTVNGITSKIEKL